MFVLKDSKAEIERQLRNAIRKCHSVGHIRVKCSGVAGCYFVEGSRGNFYRVAFWRDERGVKIADCECAGGERGFPCYHVAAALPLHVSQRRAAVACSQN